MNPFQNSGLWGMTLATYTVRGILTIATARAVFFVAISGIMAIISLMRPAKKS